MSSMNATIKEVAEDLLALFMSTDNFVDHSLEKDLGLLRKELEKTTNMLAKKEISDDVLEGMNTLHADVQEASISAEAKLKNDKLDKKIAALETENDEIDAEKDVIDKEIKDIVDETKVISDDIVTISSEMKLISDEIVAISGEISKAETAMSKLDTTKNIEIDKKTALITADREAARPDKTSKIYLDNNAEYTAICQRYLVY